MQAKRRHAEILIAVASTWIMAYAVSLLSLGCVRLKPTCKFCDYEIALTNLWSHLRWHLKRGEWV